MRAVALPSISRHSRSELNITATGRESKISQNCEGSIASFAWRSTIWETKWGSLLRSNRITADITDLPATVHTSVHFLFWIIPETAAAAIWRADFQSGYYQRERTTDGPIRLPRAAGQGSRFRAEPLRTHAARTAIGVIGHRDVCPLA